MIIITKTTVYIATHKKTTFPNNQIYTPIVAGAYKNNLPYLKDNIGDNISFKNPYYCELTILYWMWKNDLSDYVGLVHYHRYFYKDGYILEDAIKDILNSNDIIVPTPTVLNQNVFFQYASVHYKNDLLLAVEEIMKYDYSYKNTIEEVLNQNWLYIGNMFISKKEILDNYCSFLFPILFELERKIPYLTYSIYNKRVFGFLAERIFNIYLKHKKLGIYEYQIIESNTIKDRLLKKIKIKKIEKSLEFDKRNGR